MFGSRLTTRPCMGGGWRTPPLGEGHLLFRSSDPPLYGGWVTPPPGRGTHLRTGLASIRHVVRGTRGAYVLQVQYCNEGLPGRLLYYLVYPVCLLDVFSPSGALAVEAVEWRMAGR